jgi:hypothetical protein
MEKRPLPKLSTAKMATNGRFSAHGIVEIWMDGPLMHYECRGPFNTELVDLLALAQRDFLVATRPSGNWVSVCTMLESAMTSPEGIARYAEVMSAPKPDNMVPIATAFVIAPEVEGSSIMAPLYAKIYADIGRPFGLFESLSQAQAWAQTMIGQARAGKPAQA